MQDSKPSSTAFALDPRLTENAVVSGDLAMSRVLLMRDARFPWLVLVPRKNGLVDLTDLSGAEMDALMGEVRLCAEVLRSLRPFGKLNVASLGNMVPQLHVHVVGRNPGDEAWPGPVWGVGTPRPYEAADFDSLLEGLRRELGLNP